MSRKVSGISTGGMLAIAGGGLLLVMLMKSKSSASSTMIPYNPNLALQAAAAQSAAAQAAAAASTQNTLVNAGAGVLNTFLNNIFG